MASSHWPIHDQLLDNATDLADEFVRRLLWPAARGDFRDHLVPTYVVQQVVEVAVLLAAAACGTLQQTGRPPETESVAPNTPDEDQFDNNTREKLEMITPPKNGAGSRP